MASYAQGGWYDNPATGKNQRWWDGAFLPVGQTDPTPSSNSSSNSSNNNYSAPSFSAPQIDYVQLAKQQMELQKQANEPVVTQLQSTIPTIQQSYATRGSALSSQMDPLKQRYESALNALSAGSATDVRTAQIASAREFGARGIPLSSGAYDQYLQQQVLPISSAYAGNFGQISANEADAINALQSQIAGLPVQQQQDINQVQQAIAQLQAGGNQSAIQGALQMYQMQQSAIQNAANLALQQQQVESENALRNAQAGLYSDKSLLYPAQADYYNARAGNYYNSTAPAASTSSVIQNIQKQFNPDNYIS